jgi:hypothetical protein
MLSCLPYSYYFPFSLPQFLYRTHTLTAFPLECFPLPRPQGPVSPCLTEDNCVPTGFGPSVLEPLACFDLVGQYRSLRGCVDASGTHNTCIDIYTVRVCYCRAHVDIRYDWLYIIATHLPEIKSEPLWPGFLS